MVRFVNAYEALRQLIELSDWYKTKPEDRETVDNWLQSDKVKAYYGRRVVPQLTLHESLVLAFANSDALQTRMPEECSSFFVHS